MAAESRQPRTMRLLRRAELALLLLLLAPGRSTEEEGGAEGGAEEARSLFGDEEKHSPARTRSRA